MRVPFPNVNSGLATSAHMYICLEAGNEKQLAKCQTYKPHHLLSDQEPFNYIIENPDISRNPFQLKSIIDCDKKFGINNVTIPVSLRTTVRNDICDQLYKELVDKFGNNGSPLHRIATPDILVLNNKMYS